MSAFLSLNDLPVWTFSPAQWRPLTCHFSPSVSPSLSSNVGQSLCIDIFSVYRSPESRIGDHPRNRLSHFYILQKWSGQDLSSISLRLTGSAAVRRVWSACSAKTLRPAAAEAPPYERCYANHRPGGALWRRDIRNRPFASVTKCDFKI